MLNPSTATQGSTQGTPPPPRRWTDPAHPLWMCGMRPFFLFTSAGALALMLPWLAFLAWGTPLPGAAGGPFVWHAHELLYGFALASVAGFLLTAVPEFTGSADFRPAVVRRMAALWLAARVAFWVSGIGGAPALLLSALLNVCMVGALVALMAPRLWRDPLRAHLAFLWALLALGVCEAGFHADLLAASGNPARWLYAALGVNMVLIVVALSRISMQIVNQALQDAGRGIDYLARPPRRNLAIACITLYTLAEFFVPGSRLAGWLALAAAAALAHLLGDWHVGRPLLRRRPLMLYAVYACMAAGYALIGLGLLGLLGSVSGGRHLLGVGALGLAVLGAMSIAGRAHCGADPDTRAWLPLAALALVLAAALRGAAGWLLPDPLQAWLLAGGLWSLAFGLYLWHLGPLLASPRSDGRGGCAGVAED